jgi:filamentous haemagglutinin family N-terminal domain
MGKTVRQGLSRIDVMKHPRTNRNATMSKSPVTRASWPHALQRQALWMALTLALGLPTAQAQVHPDGHTQTTLNTAANGVPVVNIAAPNSAGLSHNTYQQFDVGSNGLILNNSSAISTTQLAGYVTGNPLLSQGQSASLILNEVTSTLPSQLNGMMEVAGQRAQVIVANPNGISCTGCGFINTPRGVLTTGTSMLAANGALSGFNVTGGSITVSGAGLDGSNVDRVDLIARAVAVNAGIWANQLNVVTGANQVDYSTLTTHNLTGTGTAPTLAIDVSALGGMYAGVIRLVGTEAGLGVNSQGQLAAQNGDLTLTNAGQVVLGGKTTATGTVTIGALQAVNHTGTLAAGGAVNVTSGGDLTSSGTLYSGGAMTLSAAGQLSNSGEIQAQGGAVAAQAGGAISNASGGSVLANGPITLNGASLSNAGAIESAQSTSVQVSGNAGNSGSLLADSGNLALQANTINSTGVLSASGDATLHGAAVVSSTGQLLAGSAITLSGPALTAAGTVQAGTTLSLTGTSLSNSGKLYALGGNETIQLGGAFANAAGGDIYSAGALTLNAASASNAGGLETKQALSLTSAGDVTSTGVLQSDTSDLTVSSGGTLTSSGTVSAGGNLSLNAVNALAATGQTIATGNLSLSGRGLTTAGTVQAGQALGLASGGGLSNSGKLYALGGNWHAQLGGGLVNTSTGDIYSAGGLGVTATSFGNAGSVEAQQSIDIGVTAAISNSGTLQSDQSSATLTGASLVNSGTFSTAGNLGLAVTGAAQNSGVLVSGQAITLSAGSVDNQAGGQLQSGTDLSVTAAALSNEGNALAKGNATLSGTSFSNATGAQWLADGTLTLAQAGAVSNAGVLQAGSQLSLTQASMLTNAASGTLYAGSALNLDIAQVLDNAGLLYGAQAATLAAGSVDNSGIVRSGGSLSLSSTGAVTNTHAIQAQQNLALSSGGAFVNSGKLYAVDGSLSGQVGGDFSSSSSGDIYSSHNVTLNAGSFSNAGMLEAGQAVSLGAQTTASNSGTVQADAGALDVSAATLSNQGVLSATGNTRLTGSTSLINSGQVISGQALTLTGASVSNSGQTQSGASTIVQATTLDNSGRLQAGGTLAVEGNATLTNEATGQMLAAGSISADTSGLLGNAGVIQAGGNLAIAGAGAVDNQVGGMLYGGQHATLHLGGSLSNAGTVYGVQDVSLGAGSLSNTGSLRSGGALGVDVHGNASNSGVAYAVGATTWNTSGVLNNTGVLTAAGNTTLGVGSLGGAGTLAAGLQADGTLGSSGTLTVTSAGALASHGRALAGGDLLFQGSAIDLSGSQTHAGGKITLTATQGDVSNQGGNLATHGTLTISAPGQLFNGGGGAAQGGVISAATLAWQVAGIDNRYGTIRQSGGSDLNLALAGTFDNAHGIFASNAGNLTFSAASIDNTNGAIQHAGSGLLSLATTGDLTNNGGTIVGNGALMLRAGGTLGNVGGALGVADDATVSAATVDNGHGTLSAHNITLNVAQALNNAGGTLQASGAFTLGAGTLDNTGGAIKATTQGALAVTTAGALTNGSGGFLGGNGAVTVNAGSLVNAGQIYAVSTLGVNSVGNLTNDNGALQALGSLSVSSGGALSNRSGKLEAGAGDAAATFSLSVASLDNTGGRATNAGRGLTTVSTTGATVNQGGTLGGQGHVSLNAASLDNSYAGQLVAGQDLSLGLGGMNNTGGTIYAAGSLGWNNSAASLANAQGNLGAGGNLALALASLDNTGGAIAANGNVTLNLASFTGNGRAAAGQDLSLTLAGDYANGIGNQLVANRDLSLAIGGNFSNPAGATLQAVRNLTVNAANIDNAANAVVNSATTTLAASGTLSNEGSIEGDTIALGANTLANTGNIIGSAITATAATLTNGADLGAATTNNPYQSALIAATDSIHLYVGGTLLNRDASIFTTGNLIIAADAALDPSAAITNLSGDIEASGNATLATRQFTNRRRAVNTSTYTLNASEQASNTSTTTSTFDWTTDPIAVAWCTAYAQTTGANGHQVRCGPMGYYGDSGHDTLIEQVQAVNRLASASAQSQLLAGGDITLNGSVLNNASTIAAGNNLIINGQNGSNGGGSTANATVQNIAWSPTATVQSTDTRAVDGDYLGSRWYSNRESNQPPMVYWTGTSTNTIALDPSGNNGWITIAPGAGLAATMSAGNTVSITAHTINNTVVGADGQPVHAVIGLGQNGSGQAVSGSGNTTVGSVSGSNGGVAGVALGSAPGAVGGGSLSPAQGRGGASNGSVPTTSSTGASSGAPGSAPAAGSPAAPQVVSTLVGPNATIALPQSGLYTVNTSPSSPYLVETNLRFTQYNNFISSDYLLGQLGYAPDAMLKRLGDGFYEQQQVLDQITDLTGRRYLTSDTDALAQYRTLMNNAVTMDQQFGLTVGVALTAAQMASLTRDMVWLVSVTVDGQQVLEPVVYLSAADAKSMAAHGATIAGTNVILTASGDITNNGTISASQNAQLTAANLLNSGSITAGNNLSINAAQNILNGGTIQTGGNVSLVAGNDVLSGVNVAQSLGSVNLTGLNAPVGTVALTSIQPGSITAGGNLAISAGRDLNLDTAPVAAGGNLSLAAGRDLTATATAISAGGDAQVLAGRDLNLAATSHVGGVSDAAHSTVDTTHTVSALTAGGTLVVVAGRDLSSDGAQLTAGNQLALGAGQNVTLNAVTDNQFTGSGQASGGHFATQTQSDDTLRGTTLSGANGVSVSAGNNLTATAGTISSANGNVALAAGQDLTLNAGTENHDTTAATYSHSSGLLSSKTTTTQNTTHDGLAIGTTLSGNNVNLSAGHDLTAQAVQVSATGAIDLAAGHDVNLTAGQTTQSEQQSTSVKKSGIVIGAGLDLNYQGKHTTTDESSVQTTVVSSTLSGDTVTVAAGHDLTATAAQIAGTHDVTLAAGNNLTLTTADSTYQENNGKQVTTTGYMRQGIEVTIGERTGQSTNSLSQTTPTGTLVGSTDGKVTLSAGNNVLVHGSDVISQSGTTIVGQNVTIDAALGSTDATQTQKQSQGGITGGLGGALVSTVQAAYNSAHQSGQSSDPRLKALYAAQAAYQVSDAVAMAQGSAGQLSKSGTDGGINLQVGIGGSSASSTAHTTDQTAYGSQIHSQGDVTVAATHGDLNVIGSQINGNNVALAASNDINLLSQTEQHTDTSRNQNSSGGVGVQIGTDGIGIYAQAAVGKGSAHGNGTTHDDTTVSAANQLSLISGNDTTIQGAQATGNRVLANIGGNLTIASEQDTDDYASKQMQAAGKVVIGYGSSAQGSYSQGNIDSHYASVTQTSGIGAGSGGYAITVGGNTDLKGAVIASTADPSKNLLDTGTLTYSNIDNKASYSASQVSVSGGSSMSSNVVGGIGAALSLAIPQNGNASSTTQAGIAQGTIDIRNNPAQDLSGLDRDPTLGATGIKLIFDLQKVQTDQQLGQVAGYVGMRAAGDIASYMANHATTEQEQKAWSDGGANKVILHGLVGAATAALGGGDALGGGLGAAASEKASGAMQDYLVQHGIQPTDPLFNTMMQLGSAAIGGVVGGGSGAATALQGDQFNRQLHPSEKKLIDDVLAKQYVAQHPGMSVEVAAKILEGAAGVMLDQSTAANASYDPQAMQEAQSFLHNYALSQGNPTIGQDQWGQPVPLFGVSAPYQRQDTTIFSANPQLTNAPQALGIGQVADWSLGWMKGVTGALNPANVAATVQSTVQMFTDPQGWMTQQQQGMTSVFAQAQQGNFEPAGQVEGAQAGNLALTVALTHGLGGATNVPNTAVDAAAGTANAGSIWNLSPIARGNAIESSLANTEYSAANGWYQVGAENNGYFPLVDFQQGNTLVSLKTVDTGGSTWMGRMESTIDDLANNGATVNGQPANMVLDLRVQPGGTRAAAPLIQYGQQQGVTVVVKEFP